MMAQVGSKSLKSKLFNQIDTFCCKIFNSTQIPILDQGILRNLKRSSPGGDQASIRDNGILRSSRSNVHDLELMRSLRSVHMDVGSNVHSDGLMRSLRSIRNEGIMRSLRSLPPMEEAHQDEEDIFRKPLRSTVPLSAELRSMRSSLIPSHLYDGLTLRYL